MLINKSDDTHSSYFMFLLLIYTLIVKEIQQGKTSACLCQFRFIRLCTRTSNLLYKHSETTSLSRLFNGWTQEISDNNKSLMSIKNNFILSFNYILRYNKFKNIL